MLFLLFPKNLWFLGDPVSGYAVGYPKAKALAQFVNFEAFVLSPKKTVFFYTSFFVWALKYFFLQKNKNIIL